MEYSKSFWYLKIGFQLGYYSKKAIIDFADRLIGIGIIDDEIFSISLSSNAEREEFLDRLSSASQDATLEDIDEIKNYYLSILQKQIINDVRSWPKVQSNLAKLMTIGNFSLSYEEKNFVSRLNDNLDLGRSGLGSIMDQPSELLEFLLPYNKFYNELENFLIRVGIESPNVFDL